MAACLDSLGRSSTSGCRYGPRKGSERDKRHGLASFIAQPLTVSCRREMAGFKVWAENEVNFESETFSLNSKICWVFWPKHKSKLKPLFSFSSVHPSPSFLRLLPFLPSFPYPWRSNDHPCPICQFNVII